MPRSSLYRARAPQAVRIPHAVTPCVFSKSWKRKVYKESRLDLWVVAVSSKHFEITSLKAGGFLVIFGIQAFLFHKHPHPLNQIEIGRVSWQEAQFNVKAFGFFHNQNVFLIASIVWKNCNGYTYIKSCNLFQQIAHILSGNVRVIGNRNHFMRNCIERAYWVLKIESPFFSPKHRERGLNLMFPSCKSSC